MDTANSSYAGVVPADAYTSICNKRCAEAVTFQGFALLKRMLLMITHEVSFGARHNDYGHCCLP